MKRYRVQVSSFAADCIADYSYYIAERSGSPVTAKRWVDRVYRTMSRLQYMPQRFGVAEENKHRNYDIRSQRIGDYLALYTINEAAKTVEVIGFRHGRRLPRPDELPGDPREG